MTLFVRSLSLCVLPLSLVQNWFSLQNKLKQHVRNKTITMKNKPSITMKQNQSQWKHRQIHNFAARAEDARAKRARLGGGCISAASSIPVQPCVDNGNSTAASASPTLHENRPQSVARPTLRASRFRRPPPKAPDAYHSTCLSDATT